MLTSDPADDYGGDKEIIAKRKREAEIRACTKNIAEAFNAGPVSDMTVLNFDLFNDLLEPSINDCYTGEWMRKSIHLGEIEYYTSISAGKIHLAGRDSYHFGLIELDQAYPHTIIIPETITLKIGNLFTKQDKDFKHASRFSFKFYVVTEDKSKLDLKFSSKDLNRFTNFPNAEIELLDKYCFYRLNRLPVRPKDVDLFIQLSKTITEIL